MSIFGTPLTERYNNPGALEYQDWMSKYGARLGANGRYAAFDTPDAGYQVMSKVLDTYQNKHGLNTVAGIVNRWAPSNVDNNSTSTYTKKVASALGIDPNAPISPEQRPALMRAMASYEAGRPAPTPVNASSQSGQQPMRQPYPWMGLEWPQGQDVDPNMLYGTVRPRAGAQGFFDAAMPPETAPERQAPPMPPPRGPQGPMVAGNVSRETPSEQGPNFIQRLSQDPLVMGGLMMALEGASGGNGVAGFTKGAGSAAGIQDAYMRNLQLQRKMEQERAVQALLSDPTMAENVPPEMLRLAQITKDPAPVMKYIAENEHTKNIQEYKFQQKQGFRGSFQEFLQTKPNSSIKHGLVPIPYEKPDGSTGYVVSNTAGEVKELNVPGKIKAPVTTYQTATDAITRDRYGKEIGRESKNVAEGERQKTAGEAQGKAQVQLPTVESNAKSIYGHIDALLADPYLDSMLGYKAYLPNVTPKAHATQDRINQLTGQAFTIAFDNLRGGGAITETEGKAATEALARVRNLIKDGKDYREAVADFRKEVERLVELARYKAQGGVSPVPNGQGGATQPQAAPGAPAVGAVMDGHRFLGGDPGRRESWESVR